MIDLYLRAESAGALASACPFLQGEDVDSNKVWLTVGEGFAFHPIGPMATAEGAYDEEGNEITPPVMDDRFHANLRCTSEIAALVPDSLRVNPDTPVRVWA